MSEAAETLESMTDEQVDDRLPKPVGYRVLVALPKIDETYGDSGIIKTTKAIQHDTILSIIGAVVDMGDECYSDKERFPSGPWCKVGDYVMFRANTGTRFRVGDQEFRLMNDDSIEAVVSDPRSIARV